MKNQQFQFSTFFTPLFLLVVILLWSGAPLPAQTSIWTALDDWGYGSTSINAGKAGHYVLTIRDDGEPYRVTYTGSYVDLKIPDNPTHTYLQLSARGADGGNRINKLLITPFKTKGGGGATAVGYLKIGTGDNELPPGAILRFIVGRKGDTHVGVNTHGAKGGAGTGVFMKKSSSANWVTLLVAGGGGGAYSDCCTVHSEGSPGSTGTGGGDGRGADGSSGGSGGKDGKESSFASGGGGLNGAIVDGVPKGSVETDANGHEYQFGCGHGSTASGSGGGGYSGGGGGGASAGGGGGGSYLNATVDGYIKANSNTHDPHHGYIDFQFIDKIGNHISLAKDRSKCIDVRDQTVHSGSNVQLYDCQGGGSQSWIFQGQMIKFLRNPDQCLEIQGSNPDNGANVEVWGCNTGTNAQRWIYDGVKRLIRSARNLDKCLDLVNGQTYNGNNIQMWDCNSIGAQRWIVDGATISPTSDPVQTIRTSLNTDKCLHIKDGDPVNLANIELWDCMGTVPQQWYFWGSKIKANGDKNMCMGLSGFGYNNAMNLALQDCSNLISGQQWIYDGMTKTIRSGMYQNKCLQIANGSTANAANAELAYCNGSKAQQFEIY